MGEVIALDAGRRRRHHGSRPVRARARATLYFDLVSPATYLAAERVNSLFPHLDWRPALRDAESAYHSRVPTGVLNRVLRDAQAAHPPPMQGRHRPRVLYATQGASDPRNTILVVGFQAEHTLGRRVVERRPVLQIFGDDVPLNARVEVIDGYSAHADRTEMTNWLGHVKDKSPGLGPIWLVHGEAHVQDEFSEALKAKGYSVECPEPHTRRAF